MWLFAVLLPALYLLCYLEDGSFLKTGYFMDSLTSIRLINLHRIMPYAIPFMQKMVFLGKILSFKGGDELPTIFNKELPDAF